MRSLYFYTARIPSTFLNRLDSPSLHIQASRFVLHIIEFLFHRLLRWHLGWIFQCLQFIMTTSTDFALFLLSVWRAYLLPITTMYMRAQPPNSRITPTLWIFLRAVSWDLPRPKLSSLISPPSRNASFMIGHKVQASTRLLTSNRGPT